MPELAVAHAALNSEATNTAIVVRQIAHELRQPFSTIESIAFYLDLILPRTDERARAQVDRLRKLVDQSNWIVSNAVHFVQASPAAPQRLELQETISAAAAECSIGSRLQLLLDDEPFLVLLDPGQAIHLFQCLLTFFGRIVSGDHPLKLTAARQSRTTAIRMETTAQGYTADEMACMFEPFSPGLPSGSGLMLASARRIVEAHDGSIEIDAHPRFGISLLLILPN